MCVPDSEPRCLSWMLKGCPPKKYMRIHDIHWYTLIYIDIHWYTLIYIDIHHIISYNHIYIYDYIYIVYNIWHMHTHTRIHTYIHTHNLDSRQWELPNLTPSHFVAQVLWVAPLAQQCSVSSGDCGRGWADWYRAPPGRWPTTAQLKP